MAETASVGMFELLSGLVAAEEGTRGQLSAELHDTAAQSLMLARTRLAEVIEDPSITLPHQVLLATEYVAEAEDQVRAVMARTRPPALRDGDLARAVGQFRDDMAARYGLRVTIDWPAQPHPLPLVTAITIYRFMQEALLNVVKHADGDTAHVTLDVTENDVTATVTDAGPGFDPSLVKPERGRHVGLGLLRERARLAGGAVDVASAVGECTTLTLRLPRTAGAMSILKEASAAVVGPAPQPRSEALPVDGMPALTEASVSS
jgi:signal transduction histidine kinase